MSRKKITLAAAKRLYQNLAIEQRDATEAGDYRKANRAYQKLQKLYTGLKQDPEFVKSVLTRLLKGDDIRIRSWAASHCLGLRINISEAESTLAEASQSSEFKLLGFTAEKTLEAWRRQGYLKF